MLTIRREQLEVLSAYMRQSFEDRMLRHIAAAFPGEFKQLRGATGGDSRVRALIQAGVAKARRHDIRAERDIAAYIDFTVIAGAEFEQQPEMKWAQAVLADSSLSGHGKVMVLAHRLPECHPGFRRREAFSRER